MRPFGHARVGDFIHAAPLAMLKSEARSCSRPIVDQRVNIERDVFLDLRRTDQNFATPESLQTAVARLNGVGHPWLIASCRN
jgi:hypothetical protein